MGVSFPKRTGNVSVRPSFIPYTAIPSGWKGLWHMVPNGMIGSRIFWIQAVLGRNIGENLKGGGGYSLETGLREHRALLLYHISRGIFRTSGKEEC